MPDTGERERPIIKYGVDPDPPGRRAERWAFFSALFIAVNAVGMVISAISTVVSIASVCGIVVGIYLLIKSFVDSRTGVMAGVGGAALIIAGYAILWLLRRYDLDD